MTTTEGRAITRRTLGRGAAGAATVGGALALAACGAGGAGDPGAQPVTGAGAQKGAQGRIEFWGLNSPMLETFVKEFNERNPEARAEYVPRGGWVELFEKLYAAIAGDTGPDLIRVKEYNAIDLGAVKALQPLDPYIKADKGFKADQFTPEQWKAANFDGAQYGVPFYNSIHVLLWNKSLFQGVGLPEERAPQNWRELREAAQRLARPEQGQWGFKLFDYGTREAVLVWWLRFAWTNGGRLFDSEGARVTVNSEPCVEALQLFTDMLYRDRSAAPPERNAEVSGPKGNAGLWETGAYGMVDMDKQAPGVPYGVAELPWAKQKLALVYQDNLIMTRSGKNKEGGWALLKYATEPEQDYRWSLDGGAVPSRKENFKRAPFDGSDARWKVFVDAFNNPSSRGKPVVIKWEEFALTITEELDAAFKNQKTPKQALDDAARRATQFVQENGSTRLTRHLLKDK
jgi:ABC-type glycerol-3-phosphate transport system substrate-binding protein